MTSKPLSRRTQMSGVSAVGTLIWIASLLIALVAGILISQNGWLSDPGMGNPASMDSETGKDSASDEPLYWVAPMDPNFRRDGPGLSPMGMELVPVYAEDNQDSPGTIAVDGAVIQSLGVTLGKAQQLPLVIERRVPAQVVANPETEWMLMSRVDGWVEEQFVFRVGEFVKQGEPLLSLYSPRLISAQEELLAALASRRSALIEASRSRLVAMGMTRAWVRALERRRKIQQKVTILAPQNGTVTALDLQPGRRLTPQTHLLTLSDFSTLWLEADLYGNRSVDFEVGDAGLVRLGGQQFEQTIQRVYPLLDRLGNYRLQLTLDNAQAAFLPGMWGEVQLRKQYPAVVQIPADAVIDDGLQPRVVLALDSAADDSGKFKSVAVQTGRRSAVNQSTGTAWVEVLAGLEAGDQVVTSGQFMLDSESSVSSDLLRYDPRDSGRERVWMTGTLAPAGVKNGRIVIQHQGIPEWRWPAMTQDYHLALPASDVVARPGDLLRMELVALDDGDYCVVQLESSSLLKPRPAREPGRAAPPMEGMSHDHSHH